jgi:hypothetical protein
MEGATWLFLILFLCSIIFIIVAKFSSFGQKLMCSTTTCDNRLGFKYKLSSNQAANDAVGVVNSILDYGSKNPKLCDSIKNDSVDEALKNIKGLNTTTDGTQNICSKNFDESTLSDMPPDIKDKYNTFKKSFTGAVCDDKGNLDDTKFKTFYKDVVGMVC